MRVTFIMGLGSLALSFGALAQSAATVTVTTLSAGPLTSCGSFAGYSDGKTLSAAQFNGPWACAVDSEGNLFVADYTNSAIRKISSAADRANSLTSTYAHTSSSPAGIAIDPLDNLYVLIASGSKVTERDKFGNVLGTVNPGLSDTGSAIAVARDGSGRVFVATESSSGIGTIRLYDMKALTQRALYSASWQPAGLSVTASGRLAVSDVKNSAIYTIDTNGVGDIALVAGGNGAGFADGGRYQAKFNKPRGLVATQDGRLAVADTANHLVRVVDALGNVTTMFGVPASYWSAGNCNLGAYPGWQDGSGGEQFSGSLAQSRQPIGLALAADGNLYDTEVYYDLVRLAAGTGMTPVATNSSSGGGGPTNVVTLPPPPVFSPSGGYFPQCQTIWVTSAVASVYFTTDGTVPTLSSPQLATHLQVTNVSANQGYYWGSVSWCNANADLSALRFIAVNTVGGTNLVSAVATGQGIVIPPPVYFPNSGYFATCQTIVITSATPTIYLTTDGSTPTTNSASLTGSYVQTNVSPSQGYFTNSIQWCNPNADLSNLRIISALNTGVSSPGAATAYKIPPPTFSPNSGYYPDCITVAVTSAVQTIYFTIDGTTPTTNSFQLTLPTFTFTNGSQGYFTGEIPWCNTTNSLAALRVVAALGTNFSLAAAGIPPPVSQIGFATNTYAGVGSTVVIPVIANVRPGIALQNTQFRLEINPDAGSPPQIDPPYNFFPVNSNDFVAYPPPSSGSFQFSSFPYTISPTEEGMYLFTDNNTILSVQDFAVLTLVSVQIPFDAVQGQRYALSVLYPSSVDDATLTNLPTHYLIVSNFQYFSGDSAPAAGYNAGEFGNGELDNADFLNALYASVGIRTPVPFTDAYNAMDTFPESPGVAGDTVIDFNDWNTILRRALGIDTNNWIRFWDDQGILENSPTNWTPNGLPVKLAATHSPPGAVWSPQATLGALSVSNRVPGAPCSIPVYVKVAPGCGLAGMQFRAIVSANDNAPAPGAVQFTAATGMPAPEFQFAGLSPSDIVRAWPLGEFTSALRNSNYLGTLSFQIPASASPGQSYSLRFTGVSGAASSTAACPMESFPATVMVGPFGVPPASRTSDEWKIKFFGSTTNTLAADDFDADGDGQSNYQEYLAGTDPADPVSNLHFTGGAVLPGASRAVSFGWLTAPQKTYVLETRAAAAGGVWSPVSTNAGDGYACQVVITNTAANSQFYRIRLQQ